jgi:hypothetical protein
MCLSVMPTASSSTASASDAKTCSFLCFAIRSANHTDFALANLAAAAACGDRRRSSRKYARYQEQAVELDRAKPEAILHKMQQIVHERTIWQLVFINAVGPRVAESGFGLIAGFPYTAPYEDLSLKGSSPRILDDFGASRHLRAPRRTYDGARQPE